MSLGCGTGRVEQPDQDAGSYLPEDGPISLPDDGPDAASIDATGDGAIETTDATPADACLPDDAGGAQDAYVQQDAGPATPFPPGASRVGEAPCAFPASLSFDAVRNALLMACGGVVNALFRSPTLPAGGDWTNVGTVAGYPSHHLPLDSRYAVVNHAMPDGFTILDTQAGSATDTVLFASTAIADPQGQPLAFTPNNPTGAVLAGGKLCVASSNLDHIDMDPQLTTFFPGTVICFPYLGSGQVDKAHGVAHPTSGVNPTGVALLDAWPRGDGTQRVAVLSAGPYAPSLASPAALDVCTAPAMTCTSIDLGAVTGQSAPTLAVTSGGLVLAGVQQPANALLAIDPAAGTIELDRAMPLVQNFIASVGARGTVAALSDFGVFGQGGAVLFANVSQNGWTGTPVTPLMGQPGPQAISGATLYQAMTSTDGASGSVWSLDLTHMQ